MSYFYKLQTPQSLYCTCERRCFLRYWNYSENFNHIVCLSRNDKLPVKYLIHVVSSTKFRMNKQFTGYCARPIPKNCTGTIIYIVGANKLPESWLTTSSKSLCTSGYERHGQEFKESLIRVIHSAYVRTKIIMDIWT